MRQTRTPRHRQRGFTLIEVLVAFAVFALCAGALYEGLHLAIRRHGQTTERALALATAESLLSRLRVEPAPWPAAQSGIASTGEHWQIEVEPDTAGAPQAAVPPLTWQAYRVVVTVEAGPASRPVKLESLELARSE